MEDRKGHRTATGVKHHAGLDWFAPAGAIVRAPVGGKDHRSQAVHEDQRPSLRRDSEDRGARSQGLDLPTRRPKVRVGERVAPAGRSRPSASGTTGPSTLTSRSGRRTKAGINSRTCSTRCRSSNGAPLARAASNPLSSAAWSRRSSCSTSRSSHDAGTTSAPTCRARPSPCFIRAPASRSGRETSLRSSRWS